VLKVRAKICSSCREPYHPGRDDSGYCRNCWLKYLPAQRTRQVLSFVHSLPPEKQLAFEKALCSFVDTVGDTAFEMSCGELSIILIATSRTNVLPQPH